jgi:phosphatidylglycerol:prolipoprotein diacylglycerol transferase
LIEQEAKRLKLNPVLTVNLMIYSLIAGILGARLGYIVQFPGLYAARPLSALALTPTTLSPFMGYFVGLIVFVIFIQHKQLPLRPTLDSIAPGFAFFMVIVGISHILNGDAYGAPTTVPWAIRLWNENRHPSQFYETFLALMIFIVAWQRLPKPEVSRVNFLVTIVLTAASRLFLEAFRGDIVFLPGGSREVQIIALLIVATGFYWMRCWMLEGKTSGEKDELKIDRNPNQ